MPSWPRTVIGHHVQRRVEVVELDPSKIYASLGVRWYGSGAYVRDEKPGHRIRTKMFRVRAGDFIYCILDTQKGPFGIVPEEFDSFVATNKFPVYRVHSTLLPEYLRLVFQEPSTLEAIGKSRHGSEGRSEWKPEQFEAHEIPYPPVPVQRRIVQVMGAIDDSVRSLREEITAANSAQSALISQALDKLATDGEELSLKDVATWSSGGTPKADNPMFYDGDIPWAVIGDLRGRYLEDTSRKITQAGLEAVGGKKKLVPAGAVLISMYGTIGNSAVTKVPMATNQAICRGVLHARVSAEYLRLWVTARQPQLFKLGDGKTQRNINKGKIESFPIKVPDLQTQERIVEIATAVDDQIDALEDELEQILVAREALLDALLSGDSEIVPVEENIDAVSAIPG